jgi:hypothetical protein
VKGDHPKIDDSEFIEEEGIQQNSVVDWTTLMGNIAGEIRHCGCYHDNVSIQIHTKKGTSQSSQANLWLPFQDEAFSHSNPH